MSHTHSLVNQYRRRGYAPIEGADVARRSYILLESEDGDDLVILESPAAPRSWSVQRTGKPRIINTAWVDLITERGAMRAAELAARAAAEAAAVQQLPQRGPPATEIPQLVSEVVDLIDEPAHDAGGAT